MQRKLPSLDRLRGRARSAFTLVDLTMAVAIVGIIAAVATPKLTNTLAANRALSAARRIAADLEFTRQKAIATSSEQVIRFTVSTSSYTIDGLADPSHPTRTYTVALTDASWSSTLVSTTLGTTGEIRYRFTGLPNQGGSIVVSSGAAQKTVTVDAATGKATIQ